MKRDNNLIVVTDLKNGKKKYFTKDKYVCEFIGCSSIALPKVKANKSDKFSKDWRYGIEDCSDIQWKDIDNLPE